MANINSLYLLVHPGYEAIRGQHPIRDLHPLQTSLERRWHELAVSLVDKPDNALVQVSPLFSDELTGPFSPLSERDTHIERERHRAEYCRDLLGDRFILFPNINFSTNLVSAAFNANGINLAGSIRLTAFGEYSDLCVRKWGGDLAKILRVESPNYNIDRSLSLGYWEADTISEWRESLWYSSHKERK